MEKKGCIISVVFFFTLFYVFGMVDSSILGTSTHMRRTIQEHGDIEQLDACADIIGSKWSMKKYEKSPCPTLTVWVPKKTGFTEFVYVNEHSKLEGGFSIAVFCFALESLPFNVRPIFKPFINDKGDSNGTYDDLLKHIQGKTCEAVAGDVTIRGNRAQYVTFTTPYLSSEIYILVHASHEWNQTLWTFLGPFTPRVWIALVCAYISTAVVLGFLEYRAENPKFKCPFFQQFIMVFWFPISTFFFQEGKIFNNCFKVVLALGLCMIFIVVQIYTATLSSWLTLDILRARLPSTFENAGYQNGSFVKDLIIQQYNCSGKSLMALNSIEEFKNALSNGSVNAIFDELPYIELFLAKYGSEYMKFGPIKQESGIAFAFPLESPLLPIFSRAVINVTESEIMMEMKKRYLGFSTANKSQPNQAPPQKLDLMSFIGLFILLGIVIISAIISSEISLIRKKKKTEDEAKAQKEHDTLLVIYFVIFMTIAAIISSDISVSPRNGRTRDDEEEQLQISIPDQ